MSLGSYPFFGPEGYGAHLVLRSANDAELKATVAELLKALSSAGIANAAEVEG
jgi:hypothetical protein